MFKGAKNHIKNSWHLARGAIRALSIDKRVLALPILGLFAGVLVAYGAYVVALVGGDIFLNLPYDINGDSQFFTPAGYALTVVALILLSFISTLVAGMVTHAALERFHGRKPTLAGSYRAMREHIGSLLLFSLFNYGIGYVLSEIAERIPFLGGRIFIWLANVTWRIASFFVIPVIMTEPQFISPIKSTKKSSGIIKKTWGESLSLGIGIGVVAFLALTIYSLISLAIVVATATIFSSITWLALSLIPLLFVVGTLLLIVSISAIEAYIKAAIYYYATVGESPVMFDTQLLQQAFTPKKARKIFSN